MPLDAFSPFRAMMMLFSMPPADAFAIFASRQLFRHMPLLPCLIAAIFRCHCRRHAIAAAAATLLITAIRRCFLSCYHALRCCRHDAMAAAIFFMLLPLDATLPPPPLILIAGALLRRVSFRHAATLLTLLRPLLMPGIRARCCHMSV